MSVRTNWEMHGLSEPAVRSFEMQIRGEVIHPGDGEYDAARRVWNAAWPWALTPITRSAIAAWLIGLGVAAGHAWLINDKPSLRPLGLTGVAFGALQAIALARYGNEFDWASTSGVAYVAILVALTAVSGWALLPSPAATTPPGDHAVADLGADAAEHGSNEGGIRMRSTSSAAATSPIHAKPPTVGGMGDALTCRLQFGRLDGSE